MLTERNASARPEAEAVTTASPARPTNGRSAAALAQPPGVTGPARTSDGPGFPSRGPERRRVRWLPWVVILVAGVGAAALLGPRVPSWLGSPAPVGLLFASGRIEGRITTLAPKAAATVVAVLVDEGEAVEAGQLLAMLDDPAQHERVRSAEEQLNALAAKLRGADTQLVLTEQQVGLQIEQASAALREAEARLRRARASHAQAERDAQRATLLVGRDLIAPQESEHARLGADVAAQAVGEAEEALVSSQKRLALARLGPQQLATLRAERDALDRQRQQADAQLAEQRSHVADFAIRSPIAGRILTRAVERGERVESGMPLFTLVDLDSLYVKIYVPEPSIGRVTLGQEARVYVDTYPGRAFPARVSRISQEAEFTPKNVETREERVKLVFAVEVGLGENPGGILKPGMPADVALRWQAGAPWVTPAPGSRPGFWRRDRAVERR